jgi:PTS system nitrogen regulatory IIA component
MIELSQLLDPSRIGCHCDVRSKKKALQTLAELLSDSLTLDDEEPTEDEDTQDPHSDMSIFDALLARERLGSTSLGHGVALPHSRLADIDEPIAALITLENGVDYEAVDDEPVDMLFGLLVPQDCSDEHLQILSGLAKRFSDENFRDTVRQFSSDQSQALYEYLQAPPVA